MKWPWQKTPKEQIEGGLVGTENVGSHKNGQPIVDYSTNPAYLPPTSTNITKEHYVIAQSNRRLWADALKSGKFFQTEGTLRKIDLSGTQAAHCCHGVACEILGLKNDSRGYPGGDSWFIAPSDEYTSGGSRYEWQGQPDAQWMIDNFAIDEDGVQDLIRLNDTVGASFEQIADHIMSMPYMVNVIHPSPGGGIAA